MAQAGADRDHKAGQDDQDKRDSAMESSGLGMGPGIEWPGDLAAIVGIRACFLQPARVTDTRLSPVARDPQVVVRLHSVQAFSLRADPDVEVLVELKTRRSVSIRSPV